MSSLTIGAESVQVIPIDSVHLLLGRRLLPGDNTDNFGPDRDLPIFPADFVGLGGDVLVTSEAGAGTVSVTLQWRLTMLQSSFDNIPGGLFEGSTFVDCDVPTPTPTPTATATATADTLQLQLQQRQLLQPRQQQQRQPTADSNSNTYTDSHAYGDTGYMRDWFCYR